MDELEKYIQENRTAFETHRARKEWVWDKIEEELPSPARRIRPFYIMRIAAVFLILVGIGALLFYPKNDTQASIVAFTENSELNELRRYYSPLINTQVQQVKSNPELSEVNKNDFLNILEQLDADQQVLIKEMESDLDNDQIMEEIIRNYRIQIEVIEKMMEQIQEEKNNNNEKGIYL